MLPINYIVDNIPLLGGRLSQINLCGLDAFMAHQVSEEGDVVASFQKVLCKTMAKGVWIYDGRIDPIFAGQ